MFLSYAETAFNIFTQTEEVAYAEKLRELFTDGILVLSEEEKTMTFRGYLAMKLGCRPERISAKFKSANGLGKTPYRVNGDYIHSVEAEMARQELETLRTNFLTSLNKPTNS